MFRNKMSLSILAFAGSIILFIGATFAWYTLTQNIFVDPITQTVVNLDASAGLELSPDGVEYDTTSSVITQNRVPGDTVYYRIEIENTGTVDLSLRIRFEGFLITANNPLKDISNFLNNVNLTEVIIMSASNNMNSDSIQEQYLSYLIGTLPPGIELEDATITLFSNILVPVGESVIVLFDLTIDSSAGNQYQNLQLSIDKIVIEAVSE
jgi:hypothetical protein